jgi:hypothetical protein
LGLRGFASKVQNRTWKQSVPSAVADGLPSRNAKIAIDYEYDRFTHPLPRTVLTVFQARRPDFEAKPGFALKWNREPELFVADLRAAFKSLQY